jgi:RNA polymerase sigma factor (sigma-70 family)
MPMVQHTTGTGAVLRQIRALLEAGTFCGLSDRQLLERFLAGHDAVSELAFTVLVERHGPMVLGVCRRILVDPHDVDDAFQATFLVLVRKAGSIRVEGSVGRWLFGVATRVAERARSDARRRLSRERSGLGRRAMPVAESPLTTAHRSDLRSILAEELGKLPARLQVPVILCDLEGSSHEEAARRLDWPVGTVKSRLARARARLRQRLARRGLDSSDLSLALPMAPTALPRGLVETTTRAAQSLIARPMATAGVVSAAVTTLTRGVLWTMFVTKLKLSAVALLLLAAGSAALVGQATAQKPATRPGLVPTTEAPARRAEEAARSDDEVDIVLLERAWAQAIPRRDAAIVNRIMADDFEGIDPVGNLFTKATYLPDLKNGVFTDQPIELDAIKVRLFGATAVATSRIKIPNYPTHGRLTNVYVKRQGRWQCVASHACGTSQSTCPAFNGPLGVRLTQPAGQKMDCTSCHSSRPRSEVMPPLPEGGDPRIGKPEDAGEGNKTAQAGRQASPSSGMSQMMAAMMAGRTGRRPQPADRAFIRARFDCLVEKVHVKVGEVVKKGDPLLDVFGTDLVAAKIGLKTAQSEVESRQDRLRWSQEMLVKGYVTQGQLTADRNAEESARLRFRLARDKLHLLGLEDEAIARVGKEGEREGARLTLRSPVSGTVIQRTAVLGDRYNTNDVLVVIAVTPPEQPAAP